MSYGSAGYNQQGSQSQQSSGLNPYYRDVFSARANREYKNIRGLSKEAQDDPGGLAYQGVVDQLLPIGRYGLPTGATEGVYQLGRDLFSQASGSRARAGFTQPENLEAVLGDAIRMASGQLIPQSTQVALQRAEMNPTLRKAAFGYGMTPMQIIQNLLAGSSSGTASSSGFGFSAAGGQK